MGKVYDRITEDLKNAMKAKDQQKLGTLRLIKAEILKREADAQKELDEEGFRQLLSYMKKQREDSVAEYEKVGRSDMANQERAEIAVIVSYLPAQLSDQEIEAFVAETIAAVGATGMKAMGQVMKAVMAKVAGRAGGERVSAVVKAKLSQ